MLTFNKWGVTPLPDNLPTDGYYYALQVQTGVGMIHIYLKFV